MKTPAGKECPHYYEDFHRGRERQECRLLELNSHSPIWKPQDCVRCPVPDILWANSSEHLHLSAGVKIGLLGIGRRVEVEAFCNKHRQPVKNPFTGCEACAAERPNIDDLLSNVDIP